MKKIALTLTSLSLMMTSGYVIAGEHPQHQFEKCMEAALNARAGDVVKVEFVESGLEHLYEFDIRGTDGADWDVECDSHQAVIVEIEHEVEHANYPLFRTKAKVSEASARKTALEKYAGVITEVEYEIEEDGAASYEFDIDIEGSSHQMKVEIDATSGEIVEANREIWQIGFE